MLKYNNNNNNNNNNINNINNINNNNNNNNNAASLPRCYYDHRSETPREIHRLKVTVLIKLKCYYDEKTFSFSLDSDFMFGENAPCQLLRLNFKNNNNNKKIPTYYLYNIT